MFESTYSGYDGYYASSSDTATYDAYSGYAGSGYADAGTQYGYDPFPTYGQDYVSWESGAWTTYDDYASYQGYYDYGLATDTSGTLYDSYGNTSADYAASAADTGSYAADAGSSYYDTAW